MIKSLALALVATFAFSTSSYADGKWAAAHPRRDQVNDRLANQNRRIDNGRANGTLSKQQAHQLHREDHAIRNEERADAAAHNGHITKGEQRQINRQENRTSRRIYREKH